MTGRKRCAAEAHGHFSGGGWVLQRQVDRRRLGKRGGRSGAHPVAPALLPAEQDRRRKRRRGRQSRLLPVKRAEHPMDELARRSEEHTSELQSLMRISYA